MQEVSKTQFNYLYENHFKWIPITVDSRGNPRYPSKPWTTSHSGNHYVQKRYKDMVENKGIN